MPNSDAPQSGEDAYGSSGAVLTVDLGAIAENYRRLQQAAAPAACAAVVKANAYGLGLEPVARTLAAQGCEAFFVAHLAEGIALRGVLPKARIFVLNGAVPGAEPQFATHDLAPILNSLDAVDAWAALGRSKGALPAALHLDTGMSRLGLTPADVDALAEETSRLDGVEVAYIMSHLACSEEPGHELNELQRAEFETARHKLPPAPASLANSSGIFLGEAFLFDLVRPGAALFGVNPLPGQANPMSNVVRLEAPILQLRDVDSPRTVGYGATHRITGPSRIATVAVGYADGYLRSLGGRSSCFLGGARVPVVGRVSMDLITLDVSALAPGVADVGTPVEIIGDNRPVDALAHDAGTIGYEILTSLGHRYARRYVGGDS